MTAHDVWKTLTEGADGPGAPLVLAVDFEATGRPEAAFAELAPMLTPRSEVWAAVQPAPGTGACLTSADYTRRWADAVTGSGRTVDAVLGFCAGAVFAATVAERIGERQGTVPHVVFLDPERPDASTLIKQLDNAMKGMTGIASEEDLARARRETADRGDERDLAALGELLGKLYQEIGETAFARIGLKPDFAADLVASFRSLMSYLVAAGQTEPGPAWASATAIVSATPVREPEGVAREVRVPAGHAELLRSPDAARVVSGILGRPSPAV